MKTPSPPIVSHLRPEREGSHRRSVFGRWSSVLMALLGLAVWLGAPALGRADERSTERRFVEAQRDEPSLIAFLKTMPKGGDLHMHLGGALYAETALDNAIRRGLFFDPTTGQFASKAGPGRIPVAKLLDNEADPMLSKFLDAASMRGARRGPETGHDHFFRSFDILDSAEEGITSNDVLTEVAARARAQNEQYLEIMSGVAPGNAWARVFADLPSVDDPEKALAALRPKLDAFVTAA